MTPTNDEIAQQLGTYLTGQGLLLDETRAWFLGTAAGGPQNDGRYPLTRSDGLTVLVNCPAKQIADRLATGGFVFDINALPMADTGEINLSRMTVVAQGIESSRAVRVSPFMFAARRTQDLEPLPDSEFAEALQVISNTGAERKLAVGALRSAVGNVIDPTHPPYNVVYDYQKAKPVYTTAGSNRISTGEAVFKPTDVGKMAVVSNAGSNGALVGYIGQIVDTKNVLIFTDRTLTTPMNASNAQPYAEMIWGTDCTAGMQRALDDAEQAGIYSQGRVVVLGGIVMATQLRFGSIAIVGLGGTTCGFAALPVAGSQVPFFADKNTGRYASLRPDSYALMNFSIYGQRYTQYYSSFRRNIEIRGGQFANFIRGAPYALIDGLDVSEAQWEGGRFAGAYAGRFSNVRFFQNAQTGLRIGFWDLNGQNWHCEGNGGPGILSLMPGCNVATVRSSYNGVAGGRLFVANAYWPHELGANITECGFGNTWTNVRTQESWGHSLCISSYDPLGEANNSGGKNSFYLGTFDDTGNIVPENKSNANATRLPGVRAMVMCRGATTVNNTIDLVTGAGQVSKTNYATNAYWDEGNPSGNDMTIRTPGISNDEASWYSGDGPLAATRRGPWGTASASSIATRQNRIEINRQIAP